MNCRRCRKPADDGVTLWTHAKPDGYMVDGQPFWRMDDDRAIATGVVYHQKCIPPVLFHKVAGSRPAGQSLPASSPRQRHGVGEGMRRNKPRPPHRKRKKIAAQKKWQADKEREQRQHERMMAMTIGDTIDRGGKPSLCKCGVVEASMSRIRAEYNLPEYKSSYSFITANGYCRYCGGWTPETYLAALGDEALRAAIDEFAVHDRQHMRELVGLDGRV